MKPTDLQAENSTETVGRSLRRRPLARKKLSEMVEEELEQMIRRQEFAQGEQLPSERELMEFFNVGRPSVREALAALKRKGLVQINNGERARVSMPSADTIIGELSGMAKDFLTQPGGITHFEQLRLFFESSLVRYEACQKRWKSTVSHSVTMRFLSVPMSIFTACWRRSPVIPSLWRSTLRCWIG